MDAPLRTIAEVEGEMRLTAALLAGHRARRGDTVNQRERLDGQPAEDVDRLNEPIETWASRRH